MTAVPADKRVRDARKVTTHALAEATTVLADERVHRSTRTRHAYKIRSDALERVAVILAGKGV